MNYGQLKKCDIADGPGVRVTLFVSGCRNHCPGCFQPETWDFDFGRPFTGETEREIFAELEKPFVAGLTLLGGDPFEPENQRQLLPLLRAVREHFPTKTVWAYSGYTLETLQREGSRPHCEATQEMLSLIDVLVDGPFVQEKRNLRLRFRGSENQRLIDLNKTRAAGEIVLWEGL